MADLAGAVLGAVVSELLKSVIHAKNMLKSFKPSLDQLSETLESVTLKVEKIRGIDQPEISKLIVKLEEGKALVEECASVKSWDYYSQHSYSKKILELDNYLERFFHMVVQVDMWCDIKEMKQTRSKMTRGTLEVLLVDASDLKDTDIIGKMDPYVIIQFGNQKRKSTVSRGQGEAPRWNETFKFDVEFPDNIRDEHHQYKLNLTIMDEDRFSRDDFVGESMIFLTNVLSLGVKNGTSELRASCPVLRNKTYSGEIRVDISFTAKYGNADDKANYMGGCNECNN